MTERLYYADSHLIEFTARVTHVEQLDVARIAVRLDRTAFYPTGGGQPSDTGSLDNLTVAECMTSEDGDILHIVTSSPPAIGSEVCGRIDWRRRFDYMQQHTAQHIISRSFLQLYDAPTGGFRMGDESSEIDVKLDDPNDERIAAAIELANRVVWENRKIRVHYMDADEAARRGVRQRFEREGTLRVIEIADFDLNPCGGTHTKHTGEVGNIFVTNWQRAKGMARLTFVAGSRAQRDHTRADQSARETASLFSVARDEAPAATRRLLDEHKRLQRRLRELEEFAALSEAERMLREAPLLAGGARLIVGELADRDAQSLKTLAQNIIKVGNAVVLLATVEGSTARLIFARSANAPGDMNELMREACAILDGRGGGNTDMAQGGGKPDNLRQALDHARARLAPAPHHA